MHQLTEPRLCRVAALLVLFTLLTTADLRAADSRSIAAPPAAAAVQSPAAFLTDSVVVRLGRPRAIPFTLAQPAAALEQFDARVADDALLQIIHPPQVAAGKTTGHVLVHPLAAGQTTLTLSGASIRVIVQESGAPAQPQLDIVGPTQLAAVWGMIAVGVECDIELADSLELQLPDGTRIKPDSKLSHRSASWARMVFEIDADQLAPGQQQLLAFARLPDAAAEICSSPRTINVVRPAQDAMFAGECEQHLDGPRPAAFGEEPPTVGSQASASGGGFVNNAGSRPAWCVTTDIKQPGWYQMIVRARGDQGGGALPSVGLCLGNNDTPLTGGRLVTDRWHRLPVGAPVFLPAGQATLTVLFTNDFHVPRMADRNLYLDAFELLQLAAAPADDQPAAANMMSGGMAGGEMGMADAMTGGGAMAGMNAMAGSMNAMNAAAPAPATAAAGDGVVVTPGGSLNPNLTVAFKRTFDGQPVTGRVELTGYCSWNDPRNNPAPTVTLLVNNRSISSQVAAEPFFWIDRSEFKTGVNTVQLVATLPSGERAWTPIERLIVPGQVNPDDKPRWFVRFTALDPRWGDTLKKQLTDRDRTQGYKVAHFGSNASATLELPEWLAGEFDLMLHVRAEEFRGQPIARITLEVPGREPQVIERNTWGWWNLREFGRVQLPQGPKKLHLAYINDDFEKDKGDRNLWVWAVQFVESKDDLDRTAPQVTLQYPVDGGEGHQADVIVAQAFDDRRLANVDLVIDGSAQNIAQPPGEGVGRFVLPLLLRDLTPGEHQISVRATDENGNLGLSEPVRYTVLSEEGPQPTVYRRALHLLNRFGYGQEPDELADVLTMGEQAYLEDRLSRAFDTPGERSALGGAWTRHRGDGSYQVTQRATYQLLLTDNPVRMRFVLWAQNHFSTWAGKTEGAPKWQEHSRFFQLGAAPFEELLWASATSPAMLYYLDQHQSFRSRINENYARELLELHTLGVDAGYTQADVTSLAQLLTGWTLAQEARLNGDASTQNRRGYSFRFDPSLNDRAAQTIFTLPLDQPASARDQYDRITCLLAALASHPATAAHISRQLAEHYVSVPAPPTLVRDLTQLFLATGGDMKQMLLAISQHDDFKAAIDRPRVCTPMDFAVRLSRINDESNDWAVRQTAFRSGAGLFDRATPDGYPEEDDQYATNNSLMQRWQFAKWSEWALIRAVPNPWHWNPNPDAAWRQRVVDAAALRITGRLLGPQSNAAALKLLEETEFTDHRRMLVLTTFVAQLPEANLR